MLKRKFVSSALVLGASALFVRTIGFAFRVYLSNIVGAQGMGLYSLVMSVYTLSVTVATSGISSAVAKLAAEHIAVGNKVMPRQILRKAVLLSLAISCAVMVALYVFAQPISVYILRDERTQASLRLLAPGLPFLSVCACFRGYFIAHRRVGVPASAQIIEQLFKMGFIMLTLTSALEMGIEHATAMIVLGITLSEIICFFYTLAGFMLDRRRHKVRGKAQGEEALRSILAFAVPISAGAYFRSAMRLLEDVLIVSGLARFGADHGQATGYYGMLRGMVMPLLVFPLNLLSAFVITLTPEVSRLHAIGDRRRLSAIISRLLQITSIIGILMVSVMISFSFELGTAIYREPQVGEMLRIMAFLSPFMCLEMVVVSILQGMGEQTRSAVYSIFDCVLRVGLAWLLIPRYGVWGFVLMVLASNLFTSLLNLRRLLKVTRISLRLNDWMIKPALAALAACQGVRVLLLYTAFGQLPLWGRLTIGVAVITGIYCAVLLSLGCITKRDFAWALKTFKPNPRQMQVISQKGLQNS